MNLISSSPIRENDNDHAQENCNAVGADEEGYDEDGSFDLYHPPPKWRLWKSCSDGEETPSEGEQAQVATASRHLS